MPDTVGLEQHEPTSLRAIAKRAQACATHRFQNLYRELNVELLHTCWRDLNKQAAGGVDQVTAQAYEQDLHANLQHLCERLKRKRYRTKLVRRCYIPKDSGGQRPLGIPALEDKLVQSACAKLLTAIYEQDFLPVSYGYRPGRGAKDAVADLGFNLQYGRFGHVIEADIRSFFDTIDHDWLLRMLEARIDDRAFLHLIRKWLKAGILDTDGQVLPTSSVPFNTGTRPNASTGCWRAGWANSPWSLPPPKPACCASAGFIPDCRGVLPFWASSYTGVGVGEAPCGS